MQLSFKSSSLNNCETFTEMNKESQIMKGPDASAQSTGQLCLFVVKLFYSANDNSVKPDPEIIIRCAVRTCLPFRNFLQKALIFLNSLRYVTVTYCSFNYLFD